MAFQREMAKNRYQYMVGDLRKAGLNPMLAIGGASPPSGAQGAMANIAGGFESGASTGRQEKLTKKELTKKGAETGLLEQRVLESKEAALNNAASAQAQVSLANKTGVETELLRTQISSALAEEAFDRTPEGQQLRKFKRITDAVGGAVGQVFRSPIIQRRAR